MLASLGGIGVALLGSLCYIGPLIFVAFGLGAGIASSLEPLRPLFGGVMVVLLSTGFYTVYDQSAATGAADYCYAAREVCAVPRNRRREKVVLWTAVIAALILWTFPIWSGWLI
jgi:hypothetical protein